MNGNSVIEILTAALVPLLGILTAYIAWQQWRTNDRKVRHDLYERRLSTYIAVMEFLACIMRSAQATDLEMQTFLQKTRESYFLFGRDICEYLDTLYKRSLKLQYCHTMLHGHISNLPVGDERTRLAGEQSELLMWFTNQFEIARDRFDRQMSLL